MTYVPHKFNKIFSTYKILINHNSKILVRWENLNFPRFKRVNGRMVEVQQGQAREVKRVEGLTYSMRKALEDEKQFVEEFDEELKKGGVDEVLEEEAAAVDTSGISISSGVVLSVSSNLSTTQSSVSSSSESNSLGKGGIGGGVEAEACPVQESSDLSQHMDSEVTKFAEELFKGSSRGGGVEVVWWGGEGGVLGEGGSGRRREVESVVGGSGEGSSREEKIAGEEEEGGSREKREREREKEGGGER